MKIIASAGGRFNAFHLAKAFSENNVLKSFYTTSYGASDKKYIPKKLVRNAPIFNVIGKGWKFLPAFVNKKLAWNVVKDNLFDFWVKNNLKKENNFDIFLGWANFSLHSMDVARSKGAKIIIDSSSSHIKQQAEILSEEYKFFGIDHEPVSKRNLDKMVKEYNKTDFITVPSSFAKESFIKNSIPKEKILKVSYGVNLENFYVSKRELPKKFRVICVGMLGIRKGIYYLLKAWERLNLPQNDTELLLVGAILPEFKKILKKTKLLPNVRFANTGDIKRLSKIYQNSTVLFHPSIEDGFGMVVSESMASGLPVVCTENTGAKDLIQEKQNGFILPVKNIESLQEKILWFYENRNLAFEMGIKSQEIIKDYSWENSYKNLLYKYRNVVLKKA